MSHISYINIVVAISIYFNYYAYSLTNDAAWFNMGSDNQCYFHFNDTSTTKQGELKIYSWEDLQTNYGNDDILYNEIYRLCSHIWKYNKLIKANNEIPCSKISDLVMLQGCNCPFCGCTQSEMQQQLININNNNDDENYRIHQSLLYDECYHCECNKYYTYIYNYTAQSSNTNDGGNRTWYWIDNELFVWECNSERIIWDNYDTSTCPINNKCNDIDGNSHYPRTGWWQYDENDNTCHTFCVCLSDRSNEPQCITGLENIMYSNGGGDTYNEFYDIFWNNNCDIKLADCQYDTNRWINTFNYREIHDLQNPKDICLSSLCPLKCDCGNYNLGEKWWKMSDNSKFINSFGNKKTCNKCECKYSQDLNLNISNCIHWSKDYESDGFTCPLKLICLQADYNESDHAIYWQRDMPHDECSSKYNTKYCGVSRNLYISGLTSDNKISYNINKQFGCMDNWWCESNIFGGGGNQNCVKANISFNAYYLTLNEGCYDQITFSREEIKYTHGMRCCDSSNNCNNISLSYINDISCPYNNILSDTLNIYYKCKYGARDNILNKAWGLNEWCSSSTTFEYDITDFFRRCDYITSWAHSEYACICYTIQQINKLYNNLNNNDLIGWLDQSLKEIMEKSTWFGCNVYLTCNINNGISIIKEEYYVIDFILNLYQQYEELMLTNKEIEELIANDIGVSIDSVNVTQINHASYVVLIEFDYEEYAININHELVRNGIQIGETDKVSLPILINDIVNVDPSQHVYQEDDFGTIKYCIILPCLFIIFLSVLLL